MHFFVCLFAEAHFLFFKIKAWLSHSTYSWKVATLYTTKQGGLPFSAVVLLVFFSFAVKIFASYGQNPVFVVQYS